MPTKKILLVRLNVSNAGKNKHPSHCTPPYALKYVQSLFKKDRNFEVKLLDALPGCLSNEDLVMQALQWEPEIVVLLVNIITLKESRNFISIIKNKQKVFTVAIGSIISKFIPEDLDVFLPGEGEREAYDLIHRLSTMKSSEQEEVNRYRLYKKDDHARIFIKDLDSLPFPQYSSLEISDYHFIYPVKMSEKLTWGHILSSRGCPYPCSFCSPVTRESYGVKVRLRTPANIVDEMVRMKSQGVNIISFDDDLFTILRSHVTSVCQEIRGRKLDMKWIAHSRVDNVDGDVLKVMKDAGCVLLRFGVESGSRRILKLLQKSKEQIDWNEKTKEIFDCARNLDISTHALLIIGSPTETEAEIEETFNLTKALMPDAMQIHFFNPYPGSKNYEDIKNQLSDDEVMDMHHYNNPRLNFSAIDVQKLRRIRSVFYKRILLNPKFFIRHISKYFSFYLNNRDVLFRLLNGVLFLK